MTTRADIPNTRGLRLFTDMGGTFSVPAHDWSDAFRLNAELDGELCVIESSAPSALSVGLLSLIERKLAKE